MSIFISARGSLALKRETAKTVADKIEKLLDNHGEFRFDERGLLFFAVDARASFEDKCMAIIKENIELINAGRICFTCDEIDGSPECPAPFRFMYEIVDGKIYEEKTYTRLVEGWEYYYLDNDNERKGADNDENQEPVSSLRDDDLPF